MQILSRKTLLSLAGSPENEGQASHKKTHCHRDEALCATTDNPRRKKNEASTAKLPVRRQEIHYTPRGVINMTLLKVWPCQE